MIKMCMCVKRQAHLSYGEFWDYWQNRHAQLVMQFQEVLRIARYSQTTLLPNPALQQALLASRGCMAYPFDGLGEVWWCSEEEMLALRHTAAAQDAIKALYEDECRFVDHQASLLWYASENLVLA